MGSAAALTKTATAIGLASLTATASPRPQVRPDLPDGAIQVAAICALTAQMVSGGSKTCFYNCSGAGMQMTVSATGVCPLTVPAPRR